MSYVQLIAAGLRRQRLRTLLTILSLAIAFLLFGLLQPIRSVFTHTDDLGGADRLVVLPKHSIADFVLARYAAQIGEIAGVRQVAHLTWFGGTFRDPSNVFARWAVPPMQFLDIRRDIALPESQRKAFIDTRTAAIVGRATADKYGIKVGDTVPLIPDIWNNKSSAQWEFRVVGIYELAGNAAAATDMYINYDYFDESRSWGRGQVSLLLVGLRDTQLANDVAARIDALFANSEAETRTASEQDYALSFAEQIGNVGLMVTGILAAVFFTIVALTANTMSQSIRERTAELAVLRTLGFQRALTFRLLLAESLTIALLGAGIGLLFASALIGSIRSLAPQLASVQLSFATVLWGALIAIAIAFAAGAQPAWRASRISIVDALRST